MDRLKAPQLFNGLSRLVALAMACAAVVACGDPSCPGGSISVNGRCEAAPTCRQGEVEVDGDCVDESSLRQDGGPDAEVLDGSSFEPDSGTDAAADPDAEVIEPPDTICTSVIDCGDHGECEAVRGKPRCACDDGFAGAQCEVCESGLVLEDDECVPVCEADSAPDCGERGTCDEDDGVAVCDCEHPVVGDYCTECAEGFALQGDGSCEPDCGDCGVHGFCNEELETPSCECVLGYRDDGTGCRWIGDGVTAGIADGALDDANAWTTKHVTIAGGEATFGHATIGGECELGTIEQTFQMPAIEVAEPMALEIELESACTEASGNTCQALLVETGESVTRFTVPGPIGQVQTRSICLGPSAYGEDVSIRITPSMLFYSGTYPNAAQCSSTTWPTLRSLRIRAASTTECPLTTFLSEPNAQSVRRLILPMRDDANPLALVLEAESDFEGGATVLLDGLGVLRIPADTASDEAVVCLPDWAFGASHDLTIVTPAMAALPLARVAIEPNAACPSNELDASFEHTNVVGRSATTVGMTAYRATGVPLSGASRRSGEYGLSAAPSNAMLMSSVLRLPEAEGGCSLGWSFWSRVSAAGTVGRVDAFYPIRSRPETNSTSYSATVLPLGRAWSGQLIEVLTSVSIVSGTGSIYMDDIEGTCF